LTLPQLFVIEAFPDMWPKQTLLYAHGGLISQSSDVLAIDVSGGMRKAETRVIHIRVVDDDINDDTVTRFIEYASTEYFTVLGAGRLAITD